MGSEKGPSFERDVCRTLSLWITDGKRNDIFWRNRTRATKGAKNMEIQEGDITAVKGEGAWFSDVFCIECKAGYSKKRSGKAKENRERKIPWDLLDCLDAKGYPEILKFWKQARKEADLYNQIPFVIFKRDHYPEPIISIRVDDLRAIEEYVGNLEVPKYITLSYKELDEDPYTYLFCGIRDFLTYLDPIPLKLFCANYYEKYIQGLEFTRGKK